MLRSCGGWRSAAGGSPVGASRKARMAVFSVADRFPFAVWCFAMIWADRRFVPKPLQMRPLLFILTTLSGAALTGLGLLTIWKEYFEGLFY